MEFETLVERLKTSPLVDGLMLMGATGHPMQNPHSDRDLLVVLTERPLSVANGTAFCDGVLVDLVITTQQDIRTLAHAEPGSISLSDPRSTYINWMPHGTIVLDRCGRLENLREKIVRGDIFASFGEGESIARADKALYNLAQTERMLHNPDDVYQQAIDLRMVYQLADLMVDYFLVRGMPWTGEKDAIRCWQTSDPDYFDLFTECCQATNKPERIRLYRQLVAATMEPVGFTWDDGPMFSMSRQADMTPENLDAARAFWQLLLA